MDSLGGLSTQALSRLLVVLRLSQLNQSLIRLLNQELPRLLHHIHHITQRHPREDSAEVPLSKVLRAHSPS